MFHRENSQKHILFYEIMPKAEIIVFRKNEIYSFEVKPNGINILVRLRINQKR